MSQRKRPDLREQVLGDELMVFDQVADKVHVLNITSAFVWRCLEESSELEVLEQRVRAHFKAGPEVDVRGLVARALAQFEKLSLFQPPAAGPESAP